MRQDVAEASEPLKSETIPFAHASERQFARLLDFYQIDWEYEPRSFDLEWDEEGAVIQRFTPDFYLPAYDMYIEITTMNQKLVTRKNRKVRRLKELYPEINCKIFYQRDYLSLVTKYGLEDRRAARIEERRAKRVGAPDEDGILGDGLSGSDGPDLDDIEGSGEGSGPG